MPLDRLPESTLALVSELRDIALALEPELASIPAGTPVVKTIAERRYWYLQSRGGGLEVQRYLGAETPELLRQLESWRRRRDEAAPDVAQLARLNEMVVAGGVQRESAATTKVLELLAEAGLFRRGGVLVGTRAFAAYGPMLGFAAPAAARTQDVDVAVRREIAVAVPRDEAADLATRLA
ncbi:MAG TPA: GSU2403 family nucleotidyltransferase fold protein, partial [Thermoanaerobaculia bacterium]|nr:GSU2403 family nucleotidyltransferase fold protein [Thermoanaerobaculia bacterium]